MIINEEAITTILKDSRHKKIPLHEAVSLYCVKHDIEPASLVSGFDSEFITMIKNSAAKNDVRLKKRLIHTKYRSVF